MLIVAGIVFGLLTVIHCEPATRTLIEYEPATRTLIDYEPATHGRRSGPGDHRS